MGDQIKMENIDLQEMEEAEIIDVHKAALMVVKAMQLVHLIFEDDDSSSNDEDEEEKELLAYVAQASSRNNRGDSLEELFPRFSAEQFENYFHMTVEAYETLEREIGPLLRSNDCNTGRPQTIIKKQILPSLWLLAKTETYSAAQELFGMSKSSLSRNFERLVVALNQISSRLIAWPTKERRQIIKKKFEEAGGLPNNIGAIDAVYIPIKAPKKDKEIFMTRENGYAFTAQGICDSDYKFIDVFVGYPGSFNDTIIFKNSPIHEDVLEKKDEFFDDGEYIIGDEAYSILDWCVPRYIDNEYLTTEEKYFNDAHLEQSKFIRKSWAALFGRYERLKYLDMNRNDLIPPTVLACCVLHNICMDHEKNKFEYYASRGDESLLFPDIDEDEVVEQNDAGVKFRCELNKQIILIDK
ncbi:hypothetical protein HCN44_009296 [Aphidius gifuensis]|uniref:DDE Tnp4 domain-containing protein n=1 Tax=Aphidius gifuensis TaxID=684658 RepID=A0A834Y687_APHGI|nr:protein ALP1-like [Aphidius gifuensis]KAF7997898.1 hypothetical protein HCN44_009296 [Aphidius gifuensis]